MISQECKGLAEADSPIAQVLGTGAHGNLSQLKKTSLALLDELRWLMG